MGILFLIIFSFVEWNCENLFDCLHDSLKNDTEFLPEGSRKWTPSKYRNKVNHIAQALASCWEDEVGDYRLPDMVALCEVENHHVMRAITEESPLRTVHYEYVMTDSPDPRGIDVALMYNPKSFRLVCHYAIRTGGRLKERPSRDILYVKGLDSIIDTLHVLVVHAPSRYGGELETRPYRMAVAEQLIETVDSIEHSSPQARIIIAGDFNDYSSDASLHLLSEGGLTEVSLHARGIHGAEGTYKYRGKWDSLDHILVSGSLLRQVRNVRVHDAPFLLEDDPIYGGYQPCRTFLNYRYREKGFSDHLPLVMKLKIQ